MRWLLALAITGSLVAGCAGDQGALDAGAGRDGGAIDGSADDAGGDDAGDSGARVDGGEPLDAGSLEDAGERSEDAGGLADASAGLDASASGMDGGPPDSGRPDSGRPDSGRPDSGRLDSGPRDTGPPDTGPPDAGRDAGHDSGPPDAGGGGCISGAIGTHAVRFRWAGSGSGSTAYVVYERNTLPDTSRWRVSAASASIGYTPRFVDTFLGEGGLDLGGTVFIDVELSTAGLSSIRGVTISLYGRSYSTTTSGSFTWQTFSGTGAAPVNLVSNVAPYEWYGADATSVFDPGDGTLLLRLRAGPSSNNLVVNRVEICFDAS